MQNLSAPFDLAAGWLQENALLPLLYQFDLMRWEEWSFGWALFAVYGAAQVVITYLICVPLERWRPVETWPDHKSEGVDILYTLISRVGLLPLVTFVLFSQVQMSLNGWLADQGLVAPTLERFVPWLQTQPVLTFLIYAAVLDFAEYWRHRLSHVFNWWYSLHSLHHAQRQMTFWSDDRNHILDDIIGFIWFMAVALLIGVPPLQFPMLVLLLRLLESLSHANTRLRFGWLGERLLVSPRFHRAHHGMLAAGVHSVNYGAVLPWWDMVLGTADFSADYVKTGDPTAEEALATGSYFAQQRAGLRRMLHSVAGHAAGEPDVPLVQKPTRS